MMPKTIPKKVLSLTLLCVLSASACTSMSSPAPEGTSTGTSAPSVSTPSAAPPVVELGSDLAAFNPKNFKPTASYGSLEDVQVKGPEGSADPNDLALATSYTFTATVKDGKKTFPVSIPFTTLQAADTVSADLTPYSTNQPVGVGMPVILKFSKSIPDALRSDVVSRLNVSPVSGQVEGSWRWISDKELHYRTKEFWPANTEIRVQVNLKNLDLGNGVWGGESRDITFKTGNANITTVNCDTHYMETTINNGPARVMPISCGKETSDPSFVTRSGTHLISAIHEDYVMDGASVGQSYSTPVKYAMRISNSGEFIHGAPWSVGSQGKANVSHGCVNASVNDAGWIYSISQVGDPVIVSGTDRPLNEGNGLSDWAVPYETWAN